MAGGSKETGKRTANEMESSAQQGTNLTAKELFMDLRGKSDAVEKIRADFRESLAQQSEQHERCLERMRRDQGADEQGHQWRKGINNQLDLHEDVSRFLNRAEEKISRVLLALPSAAAREALLEGRKIGLEDFGPIGLKVLPGVKDAVMDLGMASSLLAKRSLELSVVRSAPSEKVGYRTLDVIANVGNLSPRVDKALKEAIRLIDQEESEEVGGDSQGMPYIGREGKKGRESDHDGAWNACEEDGYWARDYRNTRPCW